MCDTYFWAMNHQTFIYINNQIEIRPTHPCAPQTNFVMSLFSSSFIYITYIIHVLHRSSARILNWKTFQVCKLIFTSDKTNFVFFFFLSFYKFNIKLNLYKMVTNETQHSIRQCISYKWVRSTSDTVSKSKKKKQKLNLHENRFSIQRLYLTQRHSWI